MRFQVQHLRLRVEHISSRPFRYRHPKIDVQPDSCDLDTRVILVATRQERVVMVVMMAVRMAHMTSRLHHVEP